MDTFFGVLLVIVILVTFSAIAIKEVHKTFDIFVDGMEYENVRYRLDGNVITIIFNDGSKEIVQFEKIEIFDSVSETKK